MRFILLGIGIGIGAFGVFFLALLPFMTMDNDPGRASFSQAQVGNSWAPFTSALGLEGRRAKTVSKNLVLPHWVSVPNGVYSMRKSTTAIHKGGPGSVILSFSTKDPAEILHEFYETLFLSKGFAVEDHLKPSDQMFNIVVNLFAVDHATDRSAKLIIRDQSGVSSAVLTLTTNGNVEPARLSIAARRRLN